MAKTSGPLLSFDARASVGKTIVYSNWKGVPYARRWVQPANPQTSDQTQVRSVFKWLMSVWSFMPAAAQEAWNAYAQGQPMTGRNAFAKFNVSPLQTATDLSAFVMSPSAKSGPIAQAAVATPGSGSLSIAITPPDLPVGWTIDSAIAAAIRQQDPHSGVLYAVTAGSDATDPYTVVLSSLTGSQVYVYGAWFKFVRPDGTFAYGRSLQGTATPS